MSRSTSNRKPAESETSGVETDSPRFRSYFDLLEAKYADDSTPPPAYQAPPESAGADPTEGLGDAPPSRKAPEELQLPVRHPTAPVILEGRSEGNATSQGPNKRVHIRRAGRQKLWIIGFSATVIIALLGALFWSRPQGPSSTTASAGSGSDSFSDRPTMNPPETSGSEAPSITDPGGDGALTTGELEAADDPSTWVEELPAESDPIAITFPELESNDEVGSGAPEARAGVGPVPTSRDAEPLPGSTAGGGSPPRSNDVSALEGSPATSTSAAPRAESQIVEPDEAEIGEAEIEDLIPVAAEPVVASSQSFEPPQKVFSPQPTYPEASRQAREQGTVVLEGTVSADGYVTSARVRRSASPALDRAALKTFRTWQFQPALRDNVPVESSYRLAFRFSLEDPPPDPSIPVSTSSASSTSENPESPIASTPVQNDDPDGGASAKGTPDDPLPWRGDFTPPSRFVSPLPTYPQSAWATGVQGTVTLEVVVDTDGQVGQVEVLEGLPHGISEAAVAAVERWRFRPATRDGEPVAVFHRLTLRFAP